MSWILAFAGFAALIILHELGHFAAAKAVGMRVERFSLFFGRTPLRWQRGETEYGVGWLPLGGFVKITGMNPAEEIPPEVAHRAYYRQPVWKRLVVIGAGPAGQHRARVRDPDGAVLDHDRRSARGEPTNRIEETTKGTPAARRAEAGRPHPRRRRPQRRPGRAAQADRLAQVRRHAAKTAARRPSRPCW